MGMWEIPILAGIIYRVSCEEVSRRIPDMYMEIVKLGYNRLLGVIRVLLPASKGR